MLDTAQRVRTAGAVPGRLAILAGTDGGRTKAAVLVANLGGAEDLRIAFRQMPWPGETDVQVRIVDAHRALEPLAGQALLETGLALKLSPPAVALVTLSAKTQ